jgi:hypothetical protein
VSPPEAPAQPEGLGLWITLPYSEYGPGAPIKVMCTFRNRGSGPLVLLLPMKAEAAVQAEGKILRYAPEASPEGDPPRTVTLNPGEQCAWAFTVRTGRRDLLPGDYPMTVTAVLAVPPGGSKGEGPKPREGSLRSNEVLLRIRYKVLWVG